MNNEQIKIEYKEYLENELKYLLKETRQEPGLSIQEIAEICGNVFGPWEILNLRKELLQLNPIKKMDYLKKQFKMFGLFQDLLNKGLKEQAEDEKYADELEKDKTAWFESTRGTDKPSKYFNN